MYKTISIEENEVTTKWFKILIRDISVYHRDKDLPAIEVVSNKNSGRKEWWVNGERFRSIHPNDIFNNPTVEYDNGG